MNLYFDSAATTPLHPKVQEHMASVQSIFGNAQSKHVFGLEAKKILDTSLKTIAETLHVRKEQLIPTYGGTDANRRVFWALHKRFRCPNMWCSQVEHSSLRDEILPTNQFNPFSFEGFLDEPPFMALMHAHNETGVIFDVQDLQSRYPNALIFSDWVQSVGKTNEDFRDIDFVSFSAHKIYGPKTVGLLYVKNPDFFPELTKDTHTQNIQLIAGMAKAFELLSNNQIQKIQNLTNILETNLKEKFPDLKILHADKKRVPGISSLAFPGIRGSVLMTRLSEEEHIATSTGSACSSDVFAVTPSIKVFEPDPKYQYPLRVGIHQFLSPEDVLDFCEIVEHLVLEKKTS